MLVEGRLVAPLAGLRLLTVDAGLVLTPAQLATPGARTAPPPERHPVGVRLAAVQRLLEDL